MNLPQFIEKIKELTTRNPELNYKVRFDMPEGVIHIDGTTRPNTLTEQALPADTVIEISLEDAVKFLNDELNPAIAMMMGKLKVQGSLGVALKLVQMTKS